MTTKPRASAPRSRDRYTPQGRDSTLGGILVHNAFLRIPVEEALSAAGLELVHLSSSDAPHPPLRVLVAGIEELGPHGARTVTKLRSLGTAVLVFGRPEHAAVLRALQACGALTAERGAFLARLPEMVQRALEPRRA